MRKRTITERDVWPNIQPMYPAVSVTVVEPDPTPPTITLSMDRVYAKRLLSVMQRHRDTPDWTPDWTDVSILQRLLEHALFGGLTD